ncbi:MAG: hypothetical protein JWO38_6840 [Gemmataceae bacterium]|nr:hypothetical protein [Gemmataceae bacterium]
MRSAFMAAVILGAIPSVAIALPTAQRPVFHEARPSWSYPAGGLVAGCSEPGGSIGSTYYGPPVIDSNHRPWPSARIANPKSEEDRAWNRYLRGNPAGYDGR